MAALSVLVPPPPSSARSTLLKRFLLPERYSHSSDGVFCGIVGLRSKDSRFASLVVKGSDVRSFGDGENNNKKNMKTDLDGSSLLVRTLLIDNYDSYTYNIFQDLSVINGVPPVVVRNDEWTWEYFKHQLYTEKAFDNIVISPGPGSPACPEDVGICLQVLMECADIPILGVCLGHQALGFVHGAQIVHAPEPIHGRLSEIEHSGCKLFKDIPSGSKSGFKVVRYHSLVIDHNSLPNDLIPVAWTTSLDTLSFLEIQSSDPLYCFRQSRKSQHLTNGHDVKNMTRENSDKMRVLMGIKHSTRPHYGVQFHPESIATCHGRKILKNFKEMTVDFGLRSSAPLERKLFSSIETTDVTNGYVLFKETTNRNLLHSQNHAAFSTERMDLKHLNLKLKWRKFEGLANQVGGSENIFVELFGNQNGNDSFWLDSSSTDMKRARFSCMGGKGGELWKQITFRLSDQRANCGGYLTIQDANGSERSTFLKDGFLEFLNQELKSFCYAKEDYEGLPFDFCGGFVGFIGYNMKIECGALFNSQKSETPDACFFFADNLVVVDHSNGDVYILSVYEIIHPLASQGRSFSKYWLDETEKRLLNLRTLSTKKLGKQQACSTSLSQTNSTFVVEKSRQQYMKDVEKCLQFIHNGESYELCLTTQMRMLVKNINALALYLDLRNHNPAPYAAWFNFSKEKLSICCSSPERFLQLNQNGILEAKPIKGTITRGATICEDEHFRLQLQNSEKDQAENLMIVDLLRNDLGRVCEPGTVHVPRIMEVESYATIHTLVSTIQGKMRPSLSPVECVRAAFPGGSMTGAPKLRSMEILDSLECSSRGIYSGSIGFFSYNQAFDFNIVIRTIVIHNEEASIGAGGAVVALSNPDGEYDEMMLKARAPTKAVERHLNEQQSLVTFITPRKSFSKCQSEEAD